MDQKTSDMIDQLIKDNEGRRERIIKSTNDDMRNIKGQLKGMIPDDFADNVKKITNRNNKIALGIGIGSGGVAAGLYAAKKLRNKHKHND